MRAHYLYYEYAFHLGNFPVDIDELEWRLLHTADYDTALEQVYDYCDDNGINPTTTPIRLFFRIRAVGYTPWVEVNENTNYERLIDTLNI